MKKIIFLFTVVMFWSNFVWAAEGSLNPKIYYQGDGIVVDEEDLIMEKKVLSDNLQVTDDKVVETILSNKLFAREVLKKYKDDKKFNQRFELAQAKYLGTFYRKELKKNIIVEDDVVKSYYLASPDEFRVEKAFNLQLTVHNLKAIAEKNYQDIVSGKRTFEEIVAEESVDDKSVSKKGDIGWLLFSKMPKEFRDVTQGMKEGDVSKPFHYGDKWMILKAVNVRESKIIPFDSVKEVIKDKLQTKYWNKALNKDIEMLKGKYHIEKMD